MTAEPSTLELVIEATQYVAPPERHEYIKDTLTRLWACGFEEWHGYLMNVGSYIHIASDGRLMHNLLLAGFKDGGTVGTVGLALYAEGQPLTRCILALQGDFAGGVANAEHVSATVAEVGPDWSLAKMAGAPMEPVEKLSFGRLAEIARRAVAVLDRAAEPKPEPERRPWWRRLLGGVVN